MEGALMLMLEYKSMLVLLFLYRLFVDIHLIRFDVSVSRGICWITLLHFSFKFSFIVRHDIDY